MFSISKPNQETQLAYVSFIEVFHLNSNLSIFEHFELNVH